MQAFRAKVIELETEVKLKYARIAELEARVVELSTEMADKDYEIEFYSNSIEELQAELDALRSQEGGQVPVATQEVSAEVEEWKKKVKILQQNEVKYLEEIETLKAQKLVEDRERTVNNLITRNRERSKSRTKEQQIADNDGIE